MVTINYRNAAVKIAESVYEPAEDSFLLADAALEVCIDGMKVLEIGTGTGFVASVVQANRNIELTATEINPHAALCAKSNGVAVIRTDMFAGIIKERHFDIIIFNPPYLPTSDEEKVPGWLNYAFDGGKDGRKVIIRFIEEVSSHLKEEGTIVIMISSLTDIEEVKALMYRHGFKTRIIARTKCSFEELVVIEGKFS
ncbi:HemK2/MTQ2 family protein methyltransferase [Methanolobus halotolerans]|uniref:Modification methylase HemK n=1 Tax=Methanolobus halotolerans TaxID=2052935 RepID=A0A4E0Q8R9_9EURY|nr:HemK2/MTQ2 family protein methyltransferase [Methanolobus halotolerans]TGC08346.1 modification methylase HemK [Methanolobus halotolerans]